MKSVPLNVSPCHVEGSLEQMVASAAADGVGRAVAPLVAHLEQLSERLERCSPSAAEPRPRYLTADEAAEIARHSVPTVRQWVADGRLTRVGTARRLLIREDELRRLLESGPDLTSGDVDFDQRARELLRESRL